MTCKKEYIVNEDDLGCLNDYFYAALDQNEQKTNLIRLWEQEFGVIRFTLNDKTCVYSKVVELPILFPSITHRELAFKDFENGGSEGWTSLNFKLQPGDIIQVIRKNKEKS